ncbi:MAG: outer membrane beta-barrel protein [Bacteroidales bacterium]|nr:outer membrane beta-barrel protein [Bacteroidales bacterium]
MKIKLLLSLLIIISVSFSSFAKDEIVLKVAPVIGYNYTWIDATSTYGDGESDADGMAYGLDLSAGRVLSDKLTMGVDLSYQVTQDPDLNVNGTEISGSDIDLTLTTVKLGPFVRYFLSRSFYLSGSFGFSSFWSAGSDDAMDPTAYGVGFSIGAGYDYWINNKFGVGFFTDLVAQYTWAEDDGTDYSVQSAYLPNFGIAACIRM